MGFRIRYKDINSYCAADHEGNVERIANIGSTEVKTRFEGEPLATIRTVLMKFSDSFCPIPMRIFEELPFMTSGTLTLDDRDNPMATFLVI